VKKPIFEIVDGDKHYKVYENGTIEGFSKDVYIINRIQIAFCMRMADFLEQLNSLGGTESDEC
jgi:hypothetical protein